MTATKVIFDTDPGVDDAAALLLLTKLPQIELIGVTTIFGNGDIETVTRNALWMKHVYGFDAPVARGSSVSLVGESAPPPTHVHGHNALGDVPLPDTALPELDPRPAHLLISELVRAHPGEVTIIAVGRMTNLALALAHDPGLVALVKQVVIMGGAFGGNNGNVSPAAEANIIGDPVAADIVFGADWPVVAVGLDVTRQVVLSKDRLDDWARSSDDPGLALVAAAKQLYMGYHGAFGVEGCYVHDSSAVAYVADPSLFGTRRGPVRVVRDGPARGQTIQADPNTPYPPSAWDARPHQDVAVEVAPDALLALMERAFTGG
ncbi:MAG: nucleoside hydrolase [Pseudomonadota bacterium]|nr:nucleoside hydrolase [Pseudomonadota bacterium]